MSEVWDECPVCGLGVRYDHGDGMVQPDEDIICEDCGCAGVVEYDDITGDTWVSWCETLEDE